MTAGDEVTGPAARVAVVYYSATGTIAAMARAIATGAEAVGAEVRLRRVPETASRELIAQNARWVRHLEEAEAVPPAELGDLEWADGIALGTPTRFGTPSAQLKQFIDTTGALWAKDALVDKVGTSFTASSTNHGGLESTILALNNTFYHWGALVMPLGYGDPTLRESGNPYGSSSVSRAEAGTDELTLDSCVVQGRRLARIAAAVAPVRSRVRR